MYTMYNVQYVYMHFVQCCICSFYCNNTSTNTTAGIVCRRDIIDVITTIPMAGKSDLSFRNVAAGWEGKFQHEIRVITLSDTHNSDPTRY